MAIAIDGGDIDNSDKSENIVWDTIAKTAIIAFEGKNVKFTAGSDIMIIDGKPQTMENGIKAEITDGRMFVPFRALGNALDVSVEWDANMKTAIYKSK